MTCDGCGNEYARKIKIFFMDHPEDKKLDSGQRRSIKVEQCDICAGLGLGPAYYRDAAGNRITFTGEKAYSHAIGGPITSAKQLSEYAKKNGKIQTGTGDVGGKKFD